MSSFCGQCSIEVFGEDFKELAGITTPEEFSKGLARKALCESCGLISVDPDGYRVIESNKNA